MLISFADCMRISGRSFKGVLHIGAHLGEEGKDYAAGGVRQVYWIEGNKFLIKDLFDATKLLPLKQQYFSEVLGDVDGEKCNFRITNNGQSSSILPLGTHEQHYPQITVIENRDVITSRFDTFYRKNITKIELENVDFLNLDVQGAELKVLKGFGELFSKYPNIKAVYSEVNFEEVYVGAPNVSQLDDHLRTFGFQRVLTSNTPYGWGDSLYLRP
ncbi:MAG: FkbM family methyltransferase [Candidatus Paceibacterota bacterium]|jgi:FkbM family methyltransferase